MESDNQPWWERKVRGGNDFEYDSDEGPKKIEKATFGLSLLEHIIRELGLKDKKSLMSLKLDSYNGKTAVEIVSNYLLATEQDLSLKLDNHSIGNIEVLRLVRISTEKSIFEIHYQETKDAPKCKRMFVTENHGRDARFIADIGENGEREYKTGYSKVILTRKSKSF